MNQKGMSPIVATVLLLILAISIGGATWIFFRGTITVGLEGLRGSLERTIGMGKAQLTIESISEGKIYIRNVGTIQLTDFTLYIDGRLVNSLAVPRLLDINQKGVIQILESIESGYHFVRITTAEGAEDQVYKSFQFIFTGGYPWYSDDADDSGGLVTAGTIVNVAVKWSDDKGLDTGIFSVWSYTGRFWVKEYESSKNFKGALTDWFNTTIDTTGYSGTTIRWNQRANDTDSNWNVTPYHYFDVV